MTSILTLWIVGLKNNKATQSKWKQPDIPLITTSLPAVAFRLKNSEAHNLTNFELGIRPNNIEKISQVWSPESKGPF